MYVYSAPYYLLIHLRRACTRAIKRASLAVQNLWTRFLKTHNLTYSQSLLECFQEPHSTPPAFSSTSATFSAASRPGGQWRTKDGQRGLNTFDQTVIMPDPNQWVDTNPHSTQRSDERQQADAPIGHIRTDKVIGHKRTTSTYRNGDKGFVRR